MGSIELGSRSRRIAKGRELAKNLQIPVNYYETARVICEPFILVLATQEFHTGQ
jgi:hypothetical protein